MINEKYYLDIKQFPTQFEKGLKLAKSIKVEGNFNRIIICGMGGSSFYVDLINDYFASDPKINIKLEVCQAYSIPTNTDNKTLFIVASYSGNTEETLSCLDEIKKKKYTYLVLTAGGKLLESAKVDKAEILQIPTGLQPRLSTGYFIAGLVKILSNSGFVPAKDKDLLSIANRMDSFLDEDSAKSLAKKLVGKVPVIYATDNNWSIARVTKIKFNENSKVQSYWNFFPELNHNEMVGYSNMVMSPYFMIFESEFTHPRNKKRIEIFAKLMRDKSLDVEVFSMKGDSVFEEIMNAYYFTDHVTYYLAEEYGIDPEPVSMVEEFKELIIDN